MKKRITYRDKSGNLKHLTEVNFSDLPPVLDEEGDEVLVEETLTNKDNIFSIYQSGDKGGDLDFYEMLDGKEAVVTFCLARDVTQKQVAEIFKVSESTIKRIWKSALEKIKERGKERL